MHFVSNHPFLVKGSVNIFDGDGFSEGGHFESEFSGEILVDELASYSTVDKGMEFNDF